MARIELSNIGGGGGTTLSLTTTGTSGASTLAGSVLNIPIYQGQLTLTTTGTSGAATLVGNTLNIPQYSGGGGTPAGSTGEIQYNNAGAFGASADLAWDNTNVRLNIGAPSSPTGKLNVKGQGTTSATVNLRLTDSGNTELLKVLDNGSTNIGTGFNWNNTNGRLGIGTASPSFPLDVTVPNASGFRVASTGDVGMFVSTSGTSNVAYAQLNSGNGTTSGRFAYFSLQSLETTSQRWDVGMRGTKDLVFYDGSTGGSGIVMQLSSQGASAGNVSIGTTVKDARLQIKSGSNTGATTAFVVQNSNTSNLYKISDDGKITYLATNTAAGTTGAQTINQPSGTVNFAAGASALVVTNSLCTTSSIVFATVRTNDATAQIKNVVPAAGSFTINLSAAATAETSVGFFIIN